MKLDNVDDVYRLTPAQEGMFFHTLLEPGRGMYLVQLERDLEGIDPAALRTVFERLVERHPPLRTAFLWEGLDRPQQVVRTHVELPFAEHDWRGLAETERERRLEELLAADRGRDFDLARAPLLRVALVRLGDERYRLVWTFHHLLLDGWSVSLLSEELEALYAAELRGEEAPLTRRRPFRDHLAWLQGQSPDEAEAFWRDRIGGVEGATLPPTFCEEHRSEPPGLRSASLRREATGRLGTLAREWRVTTSTIVQAAWALLLARCHGVDEVVFGNVVSGRPALLEGAERIVGMCINTLPARVRVPSSGSLAAWLQELQAAQAEQRQHEHVPLTAVAGWAGLEEGQSLFESVLVFENYPEAGDEHSSVLGEGDWRYRERTNYPLTLDVLPGPELAFNAWYDGERVGGASAGECLRRLLVVLERMAAGADVRIEELSLVETEERRRLVSGWNDTARPVDESLCLHHLVEAQCERTPDAVAAIAGDASLDYRELDEHANRLARLLREHGVGPDVPVGIHVDRSLELVVALVAVLKAGGAFVPLDVDAPPERLRRLLADSGAAVCLSTPAGLDRLPEHPAGLALDLELAAGFPSTRPDDLAHPDGLVSIYYTSGSTGMPKGVASTHRGWVNRMLWMQRQHPLEPGDRVLQKTTLSFDDSAVEFFWPLLAGGTIVMLEPGLHRDPLAILRAARRHEVAALQFVPSMLALFLELVEPEDRAALSGLVHVVSSGEELRPELVRLFRERLGDRPRLHNQWGATEVSIDSTLHTCTAGDAAEGRRVPVGRPIDNNAVYVLDRALQPAPPLVPGDLYLGGVGLARGYAGDPQRTAAAFVPSPFAHGERLYRTGDRGYLRPDGEVVFLGRRDDQVKIRGIRVEPGEVASALEEHPAVSEAAVVAWGSNGDRRLGAYVVPSNGAVSAGELRGFLADRLPSALVPSAIMALDRLPRTASGKLDRRSLPPLVAESEGAAEPEPPQTPLEERLADIWTELLGVARPGRHDSFFELGGHSLLATRATSRIRRELGLELPIAAVFQHPTIAGLAEKIETLLVEEIERLSDEEAAELLERMP